MEVSPLLMVASAPSTFPPPPPIFLPAEALPHHSVNSPVNLPNSSSMTSLSSFSLSLDGPSTSSALSVPAGCSPRTSDSASGHKVRRISSSSNLSLMSTSTTASSLNAGGHLHAAAFDFSLTPPPFSPSCTHINAPPLASPSTLPRPSSHDFLAESIAPTAEEALPFKRRSNLSSDLSLPQQHFFPPSTPVPFPAPRTSKILAGRVVTEATEVLKGNDLGGYTIPAKGLYPYQWNWDSALVAMGWSSVDEQRAWMELEKLFSAQWDDGMVPHIVFHKATPTYFPGPEIWGTETSPRGSTGITQPPIAATAVRHLVEARSVNGSSSWESSVMAWQRVEEIFPKLMKYHRWFMSARDPEGTGLVATLHPWESGMDNSPAWDGPLSRVPVDDIPAYTRRDLGHVDAAMRPQQAEYDRYLTLLYRFRTANYDPSQLYHISPFRVSDVCTNSILHRANLDLRWLAMSLDKKEEVEEIDGWLAKSTDAFDSLWDEETGIYRSRDQLTGQALDSATSGGFLPLFARVASSSQAAALAKTLEQWLDEVQYGVPSLDPSDPKFEELRYWRGPVWAIVNYMITDGLRYYGYDGLAERVEDDTRELITDKGMYEYYSPLTGSGAGGSHFSWTAAMALAWLNKSTVVIARMN